MSDHIIWNGWMYSLAGFHARTYPPLERGRELMEQEADYGLSMDGSLMSYDPDTRSWKTLARSFIEGLDEFSETWPRSGMTRNGRYYPLPPLARPIDESEYGLWPTPQVGMIRGEKYTPETSYRHYQEGRQVHLSQAVRDARMWPTPQATPGTYDLNWRATDGRTKPNKLGWAVADRMWPTPNARDWKDTGDPQKLAALIDNGHQASLARVVAQTNTSSGQLNPRWVEWLMGFPDGWTDLED